jgi:hypothetical protein
MTEGCGEYEKVQNSIELLMHEVVKEVMSPAYLFLSCLPDPSKQTR